MSIWKKVASIAAPAAGAIAGGPLLAPLGALAGSTVAGGGSIGDIFGTSAYKPKYDGATAAAQGNLAEVMRKRASGEMPSYAEQVTKNALLENLEGQQAGIRSIGGISGALKQRMILNAASRNGSEIARRGGEAALSERNDALGQYAKQLSDMRGQYYNEESGRAGAFESGQGGKRQLWTAVGQGISSAVGAGRGK